MRLLVTGLSGTLAPLLAEAALAQGHDALAWDHRAAGPAEGPGFTNSFAQWAPEAVAHLGLADTASTAALATCAVRLGIPFLFCSTAMVFNHKPDGPHGLDDTPNAVDDYARAKIAAEDAVQCAHPSASIVRIGWQIPREEAGGFQPGQRPPNHMLATLDRWQAEEGRIAASRRWIPACSFMDDTAQAMLDLLTQPGIHHLDSNIHTAWTFDTLARAMQRYFRRPHWNIEVVDGYAHDQRLLPGPGQSLRLPGLSVRLS
ncbi:MAG: sugar nucleotide-binding protein [Rubrivivax sp.]|nr:sugar nucleotide-binding protein [Rubrivivax sp.]